MCRQRPVHVAIVPLVLLVALGCSRAGKQSSPVPRPDQGPSPTAPAREPGPGTRDGQAPREQPEPGAGGGEAPAGQPVLPPTETIPPFEAVQLRPVDESGADPGFAEFYRRFQAAVAARDVQQLLPMVHPRIRISFGDDGGIAAFRKAWKLDTEPAASPLWPILADILRLGGTFVDTERTMFFAPYVYSRFPEQFDAFRYVAVTGEDVSVRVEPRPDAGVVERVSYLVVEQLSTGEAPPRVEADGRSYTWVKVGLPSGKVGWVLSRDVWSPVGYRAGFRRENGNWQMTVLVAGD